MALLIDIGLSGWITDQELLDELKPFLPDADIRLTATDGDPMDITMLATSNLAADLPAKLPGLKLVQKLGAGVETIVAHPALPDHVRVARLKPELPAQEIAEFCLAYVLREQRNMRFHAMAQSRTEWSPVEPRQASQTIVGVLGLGHIGGRTAHLMQTLGFQVLGWSRSPKNLKNITCLDGEAGLHDLLRQSDYVCSILPSTGLTRSLLDTARLARMKPGSTLINCGRGDLIDEAALVTALNAGTPGHAVLDVVSQEPLPETSDLWCHPDVTITPHVSGWHLGDALKDIAENYNRLGAGDPLLHEVDRERGY